MKKTPLFGTISLMSSLLLAVLCGGVALSSFDYKSGIIIVLFLSLLSGVSLITGILSLFKKEKKKIFALTGIIISSLYFLYIIAVVLLLIHIVSSGGLGPAD